MHESMRGRAQFGLESALKIMHIHGLKNIVLWDTATKQRPKCACSFITKGNNYDS